MSDINPKKKASLAALLPQLFVAAAIYLVLAGARGVVQHPDMSLPSDRAIVKGYAALRLTTYFPSALQPVAKIPALFFILDFFLFAWLSSFFITVVLKLLWALVFVKPKSSIVEDPAYVIQHLGVDTPELNHLDDIVYVCPNVDWKDMIYDFILGAIKPEAPASKAVTLTDDPTRGQKVDFHPDPEK